MSSPKRIIQQLLIDLGHGTDIEDDADWPICSGFELDEPDDLITIYDTGGISNSRSHRTRKRTDFPGIQVMIRAVDDETSYNKAKAISDALDGVAGASVTVDEVDHEVITLVRSGTIASLGVEQEGKRRYLHSVNFLASLG